MTFSPSWTASTTSSRGKYQMVVVLLQVIFLHDVNAWTASSSLIVFVPFRDPAPHMRLDSDASGS